MGVCGADCELTSVIVLGTKRLVEGKFREGDTCLIIEDTVTSGSSILETAEVLSQQGLKVASSRKMTLCCWSNNSIARHSCLSGNVSWSKVTDAVVVMDREQGAVEMLASKGIRLHPIFSLFKLLDVLLASERIDQVMADKVRTFILANNTFRYFDQSGRRCDRRCRPRHMLTFGNLFSGKEENGNGVPASKKLCMEQKVALSYAERAKLPSV